MHPQQPAGNSNRGLTRQSSYRLYCATCKLDQPHNNSMQQQCSCRRSVLRYTQHVAGRPCPGSCVTCGAFLRQPQHRPYRHDKAAVPSTGCRARLPHMDEEMEHMQWQLDKRSHEDSTDQQHSGSGSTRHSSRARHARGQQHVFHERNPHPHRRSTHMRQHQRHQQQGSRSAAEGEQHSPSQPAVASASSITAAHEHLAGSGSLVGGVRGEQAAQQQQAPERYHHLQLQASAAAADLPKACDRLLKHILQDGGCYVSAPAAQAGVLSHLLLLLQHRQVQEQQGMLLLLQPAAFEQPQELAAALAAGGAGSSNSGIDGSDSGNIAVATPSGQQRRHAGNCSIELLNFWATVVPLEVLLDPLQQQQLQQQQQQQQQQVQEAAGPVIAAAAPAAKELSSSCASPASRTQDGGGIRLGAGAAAALLNAAGRSCSAVGALLLAALAQRRLQCVTVGSHADTVGVCGNVMQVVTAGNVEALHVKGCSAAHAVAYAALELAAAQLLAGNSPCGFGVLLVPGHAHEHVHAVRQGHVAAVVPGTAAGQRAGEQHGSGKLQSDASMAVGGFEAASHGVGYSSGGRASAHWLQHRHAQELWLCVVPLALLE